MNNRLLEDALTGRRLRLACELTERLIRGEQLVIHGPRGIGKTTFVTAIQAELRNRAVPSAIAPSTGSLSEVTAAFRDAYASAMDPIVTYRRLRSALTAERKAAILLLDHVTNMTLAMRKFLRSLGGNPVGVAYIVDVDTTQEHARMRSWQLVHPEFQICPISRRVLKRMFRTDAWARDEGIQRTILRAARGRPGFIQKCRELAARPMYWKDGRLLVATLCSDAEFTTRGVARRGPQ